MRILAILTVFLFHSASSMDQSSPDFFGETDRFFKQYVSNGLVDYAAIKSNPGQLNKVVQIVEGMDLSDLSSTSKKAFWINAYNILVVKAVVSAYPIKSPMDVPGFFDQKKHQAAGMQLTLNDIENKKIRPVYKDARIHFALVCAAMGCPKIISKAYRPETLDKQLTTQTQQALNDPIFTRVSGNVVQLSEIFKWYQEDFTMDGQKLINFINKYRSDSLPLNISIDYYTYDWNLNIKKN